jgi:structural maintenance of chromosome 1
MGRLKQLELDNFKSYHGKQVVGPFDDFTCIIGPNGAGKSNMMDAISFVLGVQSRHLRSSHLKELIFKKDANAAPARKASVKLVYEFADNEVDEYDGGTEIHFSRSISGAGVSSYRLDNREVTYEVYENLLQRIGVLVKARNFLVFQGDVESVASKSPADLTKLLEQICGSDTLQAEYDDLLNKRTEAEENTLYALQKKKMFATQKKEVKEQKDEAEVFQEKQDELADLKSECVLVQLWRIVNDIEEQHDSTEKLSEDIAAMKDSEVEISNDVGEQKKELARCNKACGSAEKDLNSRKKKADSVSPQLEEVAAKLKSLRKRLNDLGKSEAHLAKDRAEQTKNVALLSAEIEELTEQETAVAEALRALSEGDLHLNEEKVAEYGRLREELAGQTAQQTVEQNTLKQEMKSRELQLKRIEAQEHSILQEAESEEKMIVEYEARSAKLRDAVVASNEEIRACKSEREAVHTRLRKSTQEAEKLQKQLEEVNGQLRNAGDERRRNKQEEKMNEAIDAMQRIFSGVHGRLVDLCRPIQKRYGHAVAVTAGRQMDAVVVESKHVAAECIRYLKDQRIGTCVFLPLDNISPQPVPERLRSLGSRYRLCVDLVECEDMFKPVVTYALGSTVVCDTLDDARDLCFRRGERVKTVTLGGQVIGKSGAMTGGSMGESDVHDRWEEQDMERLRRKKAEISEAIAANKQEAPSRQHLAELETRLKSVQTRIQYSETDASVSDDKASQLKKQKAAKTKSLKALTKEMDTVKGGIAKLEADRQELHERIRTVEERVFGSFSQSIGVENIREYEETQLKQHQDLQEKRAALTEQKAALVAQLDYENKRDFSTALKRFRSQIVTATQEVESFEAQAAALRERESEYREAVTAAEEAVKRASEEKGKASADMKSLQQNLNVVTADREGLEKKLAGVDILIERARAKLHEVMQRAQVEEIALPTREDDGDTSEHTSSVPSGPSAARSSVSTRRRSLDEDLRWHGARSQSSRFASMGGNRTSGQGKRSSKDRDSEDGSERSSDQHTFSSGTGFSAGTSAHFSQADNTIVMRDQRKVARVDLSSMEKLTRASKQKIDQLENDLSKQIAELTLELEAMTPNMHAMERYEGVLEKLAETNEEFDSIREQSRQITQRFEEVKAQRQEMFQDCFQHVSNVLSTIYKDLTKSSRHPLGGNAYLTLDNTEEPYLGGIRFTAMPPMKRFRDMEQLSGGEKTMAALALLFSIHSYRQAPFFVLDEVDAALDNVNVKKICNYMRQRSKDFQCIVISLKDMFFEHADCLVGVCKDVEALSSRMLTLDLKKYDSVPSTTSPATSAGGTATPQTSDMHSTSKASGTWKDASSPSQGSLAGSVRTPEEGVSETKSGTDPGSGSGSGSGSLGKRKAPTGGVIPGSSSWIGAGGRKGPVGQRKHRSSIQPSIREEQDSGDDS